MITWLVTAHNVVEVKYLVEAKSAAQAFDKVANREILERWEEEELSIEPLTAVPESQA